MKRTSCLVCPLADKSLIRGCAVRYRLEAHGSANINCRNFRDVVTNCDHLQPLKVSPYLPDAFTEHGAIMTAKAAVRATGLLRSVMGEDKVASFFPRVAGKAGFHLRLGAGLAVFEDTKPPAARRGVLY